jgi:hypothetical protein
VSAPVLEPDPSRAPRWQSVALWYASRSAGWRTGALTYGIVQTVLLGWWIAFYPGTLSYDSIMYVWQVSTSNWTTQHSTVYNGLVWLALRATGQLGVLSAAQTIAMAAGVAYTVVGLSRLAASSFAGVRARWFVLAATVGVALPFIGTFTVYISKDVPFTITQLCLLGTIARILALRATAARPGRALWAAVLAEFLGMGLFRQNGVVAIAFTAALLVLVLSGIRWRIVACAGAAILVSTVSNLAVYPALGVRPVGSELLFGPVYADIAVAFADRPDAFTAADRRLLSTVAPLEYWRTTANCYNADSTVTYANPEFNFAAAAVHQSQLLSLWLSLAQRVPGELAAARLCRGFIAWSPVPAPAAGRTVKVPVSGVQRHYDFPADRFAQTPFAGAIGSAPLSSLAHQTAIRYRHLTDAPALEWLTWRGATWCYVAYIAVAVFARRRRDLALAGLAAVILANQLNVLINNPGQLVRYMTAPILLGLLLLPLAFTPRAPHAPHRPD